jgi:hypothetical protein
VSGFIPLVAGITLSVIAALQVSWATNDQYGLTIVALERQEEVRECLEASLLARVRFEARLCHRRRNWFDGCEDTRSEVHTIQFDEVTESYRVVSDRLGDKLEATAVGVPSRAEAVKLTLTVPQMPLEFLARDNPAVLWQEGTYVQVRTGISCRGGGPRMFAHLSRILTLGLVNTVESRSSWHDFTLYAPAHTREANR